MHDGRRRRRRAPRRSPARCRPRGDQAHADALHAAAALGPGAEGAFKQVAVPGLGRLGEVRPGAQRRSSSPSASRRWPRRRAYRAVVTLPLAGRQGPRAAHDHARRRRLRGSPTRGRTSCSASLDAAPAGDGAARPTRSSVANDGPPTADAVRGRRSPSAASTSDPMIARAARRRATGRRVAVAAPRCAPGSTITVDARRGRRRSTRATRPTTSSQRPCPLAQPSGRPWRRSGRSRDARLVGIMKTEIHPSTSNPTSPVRAATTSHALDPGRDPRRDLLPVPSVLHGQAEARGHGRTRRALQAPPGRAAGKKD